MSSLANQIDYFIVKQRSDVFVGPMDHSILLKVDWFQFDSPGVMDTHRRLIAINRNEKLSSLPCRKRYRRKEVRETTKEKKKADDSKEQVRTEGPHRVSC